MTTKEKILAITSTLGVALALLTCSPDCFCSVAGAQAQEEQGSCTLPTRSREEGEAQYRAMLRGHDATLANISIRIDLRGDTAALRRRIESAAAIESECCTFMTMGFEPTATGGMLEVSAAGEGGWLIVPMLEALR